MYYLFGVGVSQFAPTCQFVSDSLVSRLKNWDIFLLTFFLTTSGLVKTTSCPMQCLMSSCINNVLIVFTGLLLYNTVVANGEYIFTSYASVVTSILCHLSVQYRLELGAPNDPLFKNNQVNRTFRCILQVPKQCNAVGMFLVICKTAVLRKLRNRYVFYTYASDACVVTALSNSPDMPAAC